MENLRALKDFMKFVLAQMESYTYQWLTQFLLAYNTVVIVNKAPEHNWIFLGILAWFVKPPNGRFGYCNLIVWKT